jgi:hypothetical protein
MVDVGERAAGASMNNDEILGPDPLRITASLDERRGAVRYPCDLTPSWHFSDETEFTSSPAGVRDLSSTGIGLLMKAGIKPGRVLIIHLQSSQGCLSRPVPVRVMHATFQPDGDWLVGCQFLRRLSHQDMLELLGGE